MAGYVYLFTNEAMPGWVKIGKTEKAPRERADALFNTSVPFRFDVAFAIEVPDPDEFEDHMHETLDVYRPDANREFFSIPLRRAKEQILKTAESILLPNTFRIETDIVDDLDPEKTSLPDHIQLPKIQIGPAELLDRLNRDSQQEVDLIAAALIHAPRIAPSNTEIVPRKPGVYAWFREGVVAYVGSSTAGSSGLYQRIVLQHLKPTYLEPRESIWTERDQYQIDNPMLDRKGRHAIDKSAFRKSVARTHRLLAGEESVEYLKKHFTFSCMSLPNAGKTLIHAIEKALTRKYNPQYNTSNKRPRPNRG
jgi:hypothetical protein